MIDRKPYDRDEEFVNKLVNYYIEIKDYQKCLKKQQEEICTLVEGYLKDNDQEIFIGDYCVAALTFDSNKKLTKKAKRSEKVIVLMDKLIEKNLYEAININLHNNLLKQIVEKNIGINEYLELVKDQSVTNKERLIGVLNKKINYYPYIDFNMKYIAYALHNNLIEKSCANNIIEVLGPPTLKIARKGDNDEIFNIKQDW